jgi:hypothetical protein
MTSQIISETAQQDLEGRSVRDVVTCSPEEVNDAWCRKILRKILQSLELQYAMDMPRRAVTPDTVVFHANGEPFLLSDDIDAAPAPAAQQADDLTALAHVLHYAITQERAPTGPLGGRIAGYSAAVIAAIDACMDPDPARRPHSIDAVRGLLGIAPTGLAGGSTGASDTPRMPDLTLPAAPSPQTPMPAAPSIASTLAPAFAPAPAERANPDAAIRDTPKDIGATPDTPVAAQHAAPRRGRRWAIAGGGAVALALALASLLTLRNAGPDAPVVQQPPQNANAALPAPTSPVPRTEVTMETQDARVPSTVAGAPTGAAATASPASGASSGGTTQSGGGGTDSPEETRVAADRLAATAPPAVSPRAAEAPANRAATTPGTVSGNASYQLQIKPWGTVYVDGVERGVSPPLKRLALTPGAHTIRITNPSFGDSVLEFNSERTTSNGKIIVDFEQEAQ